MSWFSKEPEPDSYAPPPRVAPPEFVAALKELKDEYLVREKQARAQVVGIAQRLSEKTYFNYGDMDRAISDIRCAMSEAITNQGLASEMGDRIRSYEYQGRRPAYMPALPSSPVVPSEGE